MKLGGSIAEATPTSGLLKLNKRKVTIDSISEKVAPVDKNIL